MDFIHFQFLDHALARKYDSYGLPSSLFTFVRNGDRNRTIVVPFDIMSRIRKMLLRTMALQCADAYERTEVLPELAMTASLHSQLPMYDENGNSIPSSTITGWFGSVHHTIELVTPGDLRNVLSGLSRCRTLNVWVETSSHGLLRNDTRESINTMQRTGPHLKKILAPSTIFSPRPTIVKDSRRACPAKLPLRTLTNLSEATVAFKDMRISKAKNSQIFPREVASRSVETDLLPASKECNPSNAQASDLQNQNDDESRIPLLPIASCAEPNSSDDSCYDRDVISDLLHPDQEDSPCCTQEHWSNTERYAAALSRSTRSKTVKYSFDPSKQISPWLLSFLKRDITPSNHSSSRFVDESSLIDYSEQEMTKIIESVLGVVLEPESTDEGVGGMGCAMDEDIDSLHNLGPSTYPCPTPREILTMENDTK